MSEAKPVKRYECSGMGCYGLSEDSRGEWVSHADHQAAIAEARREALEDAVKRLREMGYAETDSKKSNGFHTAATKLSALLQPPEPVKPT